MARGEGEHHGAFGGLSNAGEERLITLFGHRGPPAGRPPFLPSVLGDGHRFAEKGRADEAEARIVNRHPVSVALFGHRRPVEGDKAGDGFGFRVLEGLGDGGMMPVIDDRFSLTGGAKAAVRQYSKRSSRWTMIWNWVGTNWAEVATWSYPSGMRSTATAAWSPCSAT